MEKLRRLREGLKQLRCAGPGRRFQAHYERAHEPRGNYGMRALCIIAGVGLESQAAERFFDWLEVKLRRIVQP